MSRCRVYWGSHGCERPRGHGGLHECDCCSHASLAEHVAALGIADDRDGEGEYLCVATWPYYGDGTALWGEDTPAVPADR